MEQSWNGHVTVEELSTWNSHGTDRTPTTEPPQTRLSRSDTPPTIIMCVLLEFMCNVCVWSFLAITAWFPTPDVDYHACVS